ncbi:hypothetical protein pb186bvf_000651 [Paramecium bursaria]
MQYQQAPPNPTPSPTPSASPTQITLANYFIVIPASLTMITTMMVIMKYFLNKGLRNFEFFQITVLSAGDFIQASSISIPVLYYWITQKSTPDYNNSGYCAVQGFFQLMGCLFQFIWTLNIAVSCYLSFQQENIEQYNRRRLLAYLIGFGIPLSFPFIPLGFGYYGQSGQPYNKAVCFIQTGQLGSNLAILFCFQIPMIFSVVTNTVIYRKILVKHFQNSNFEDNKKVTLSLMQYPLILILCQGWFVIYFFLSPFGIESIDYQLFCYLTSNLTGFFDALAYGLNSNTQDLNAYSILSRRQTESNSTSFLTESNQLEMK